MKPPQISPPTTKPNHQGEEKPTGELGVEYTGSRFAVKAEADLVQLAKAKASAVVAHEGGKVRRRRGPRRKED
jgi:hypothetical protein